MSVGNQKLSDKFMQPDLNSSFNGVTVRGKKLLFVSEQDAPKKVPFNQEMHTKKVRSRIVYIKALERGVKRRFQ